jgi:hypothetical protein
MASSTTVRTPLSIRWLVFLWISCLSGCSVTQLQNDELQEPEVLQSGGVAVRAKATGFSAGRVGWGRITVFSIPAVPIRIHSDEASDLMEIVRNALTTAGYTARPAGSAQAGPVLKAHVDHVRFNNYTWVAPIVSTWGRQRA